MVHVLDGAQVIMPPLELQPMESRTVPLVVRVPGGSVDRTTNFEVEVRTEETSTQADATFKAPPKNGGAK